MDGIDGTGKVFIPHISPSWSFVGYVARIIPKMDRLAGIRASGLCSAGALFLVLLFTVEIYAQSAPKRKPIVLDSSGGFTVGGSVLTSSFDPNSTLSCDHGYMESFLPWSPRKTSLVMWHSSGTQTFQNRFDGGEGYKDMFLRRDYPVYLWEGPRIGRANWPCVATSYFPQIGVDQVNFLPFSPGVQSRTD